MPTIRPTFRMRRLLGVVAAPALLLAAACGDDGGGGGSAEAFCDKMDALDERFENVDPTSENFGEALVAVRELDPPAEIADDWAMMLDAFEQLSEIDFSDPEAMAAFEEEFDTDEYEQASERIDNFQNEECGDGEE